MKKYVIVVTGQVATGKTRLAKYLSKELNIPLISKDDIKELLFDSLGTGDREWSRKLGQTCYKIIYHYFELLAKSNISLILESNFNSKFAGPEISAITKKYNFDIIQIFLQAGPKILFKRYQQRISDKNRHPDHVTYNNYNEFIKEAMANNCNPIRLNGQTIKINTDDFELVDYKKILRDIKKLTS